MSKFQSLIRQMIRSLTSEAFVENHRPDWLFGMELDFFFPRASFAIEVQGQQHKQFVPELQSSPSQFDAQVARDKRKLAILQQRGIKILFLHQDDPRIMGRLAGKLAKALQIKRIPKIHPRVKESWTNHDKLLKRMIFERPRSDRSRSLGCTHLPNACR